MKTWELNMEPRFTIKCGPELIALTIPEMEKLEMEIRSLLLERYRVFAFPEEFNNEIHAGCFTPKEKINLSQLRG